MGKVRGGSRAAATSKMERFVIITIITKRSILIVAAALDPPLNVTFYFQKNQLFLSSSAQINILLGTTTPSLLCGFTQPYFWCIFYGRSQKKSPLKKMRQFLAYVNICNKVSIVSLAKPVSQLASSLFLRDWCYISISNCYFSGQRCRIL